MLYISGYITALDKGVVHQWLHHCTSLVKQWNVHYKSVAVSALLNIKKLRETMCDQPVFNAVLSTTKSHYVTCNTFSY